MTQFGQIIADIGAQPIGPLVELVGGPHWANKGEISTGTLFGLNLASSLVLSRREGHRRLLHINADDGDFRQDRPISWKVSNMRTVLFAATIAAAIVLAPSVASAQGCPMGQGRGMGPGYGMGGIGMMGQRGGRLLLDPANLAPLKDELGITPQQDAPWSDYADAVRALWEFHDSMQQSMVAGADRQALRENNRPAGLEMHNRVWTAREALSKALTADQRHVLDRQVPTPCFRQAPPNIRQ